MQPYSSERTRPTCAHFPHPRTAYAQTFPQVDLWQPFDPVFLKTLTLKGFKSFADATTLDLERGITVVVGPNGSGKSNIVDAVAWVLGAQGAKTIRSNKMEDVIFAGTSKKAALGRAEVSLTIDNASGTLPIEFSEVTITRTLFRTGESEYAINGVGCRLLDVQELLSDSGVGRQQHVIVGQGQLAAILDSRPEDRRAVIEEAAGILKYRKRRDRAQRRLESTEANFVRLGDLLREIRRQLRPLERQAESARKHEEWTRELRAIRMHLAGRELSGLQIRAETSARSKSELTAKENEFRRELARLDAEVMMAESDLSAMGGGGAKAEDADDPFAGVDLGEVLGRAEALYERARGQLSFLGERRRSIERDRNAFVDQGVVESLSAEAARLIIELEKVENEAYDLPPLFDELADQELTLATERDLFLSEWGADNATTDGPSLTAAEVRSKLNGVRTAIERAQNDGRRLESRDQTLRERIARLVGEAAKAEADLAELVAAIGDGEIPPALLEIRAERTEAEAAQQACEADAVSSEEALRAAEGERRAWKARAEALSSALDEARARAGAQRLAGLDGIVGTLLDLVEVDAGWESAFEAAIGEAISSVVVRDADVARNALSRLHEKGLSGAVLAINAIAGGASSEALAGSVPSEVAGGSRVRTHVRSSDPNVERALDALLRSAVAVDGTWTAALDLALANPGAVVVTKSGDRFASTGWRAGAGSSGATGAALDEAKTKAAEADALAATAKQALDGSRAKIQAAKQVVQAVRQREQGHATEHQQRIGRRNALQVALPRLHSDRTDTERELALLESQRADLAEAIANDEAQFAALNDQLPALVEAENEIAVRQAKRREAAQRLDQRAGAVSALRRELEVRAAGIEERRRLLVSRQDEIDERLSRSVAEREVAEQRRQELDRQVERTDALHALIEDRAAQLEVGLVELRDRRRRQNEAARMATSKLDGFRRTRGEVEKQLSLAMERLQRNEIEAAEIRLRLETLVEQVRREFDAEPNRVMAAECPPNVDPAAPAARARELERELRLLGPINPLALEEFTSLRERNQLIESELEDVKTARRDLAKVIKAIDEEIVTVFNAAYADVARNFNHLFEMLFPGGQGSLRLTDPDNPLETGVEVEARPSGKNVRKLSLLSGGERSLTAMAFLFAVFRSRPSPFYLLDEVEAALDDLNLHRFLHLLHEFRQEAQLLVVSHQKRTMEAADCLYGVSMQPGGSSRVVSEKLAARS